MSTSPGFVRSTLIGGVLYLVPIVLLVAIFGKAMQIAERLSPPIVKATEAAGLGHLISPQGAAICLLILFCMAAGVFAHTAIAKRIGATIDSKLANIPGYTFYKGVGDSLAGAEPTGMQRPVMARIEDAWQMAMVVDELENGLLAVYVPGVPEARTGSLYFMDADRVRPLPVSVKTAMVTLRRMGVGSRNLLKDVNLHVDTPAQ